jgi:hypothetical protein
MINDYARQLMDAHGQRAIAEAAQRAPAPAKKIDNFLPSRRDGGIVFQKGQATRIALFIDVRAPPNRSQSLGT